MLNKITSRGRLAHYNLCAFKKPCYILTFPPIIMFLSAVTLYWFSSAFLCVKDCLGPLTDRGREQGAEIPRVSSQSDENRLNANEGKLLTVKLNSGQGCGKMHTKEERIWFAISSIIYMHTHTHTHIFRVIILICCGYFKAHSPQLVNLFLKGGHLCRTKKGNKKVQHVCLHLITFDVCAISYFPSPLFHLWVTDWIC